MFFKNPFMSERSEFKRIFKKHTDIAGDNANTSVLRRQQDNGFGFKILCYK